VTFLLAALGAWSVLLAVVSARAILLARARHAPANLPGPSAQTRVLLLRPCCGLEPGLSTCLASAAVALPRGELRVLHLVADETDPAWPVARAEADALRAGGLDASALVTGASAPNRKADQLARGASAGGDFDLLLCADSDVSLDAGAVTELLAAVSRPGVGAAWAPPVEVAPPTADGDRASQAVLAGSLHAFVLLAGLDHGGMVGKLFAVRRDALLAAGGLEALAHVLGEDVELGRRLRAAGHEVVVTAHPAHSLATGRSLAETVARYARWMQVVRGQRPALLLSYPVLFFGTSPLVLLGAGLALAGHAVALGPALLALVARVVVSVAARLASRTRPTAAVVVADVVLAEAVLAAAFAVTLLSRRFNWRGRALELRRGRLLGI
jgi:ceramide glucosyltransferase